MKTIRNRKGLKKVAQRVHSSSLVFDAHSDIILDVILRRLQGQRDILKRIHYKRLRAGGVSAAIVPLAWDDPTSGLYTFERLVKTFALLEEEVENGRDCFMIVSYAHDIAKAAREGKIGLVPSVEGSAALTNDLSVLKVLRKMGLRCVGLTWNPRNQFADGVGERKAAGLSALGFELVRAANKQKLLIDLSHASDKAFWDVIETTKAPVIASHSNARKVHPHRRNLDNDQLKALAEKRGVVGINFYPEFVATGRPTIRDVVRHVDYLTRLVGVDYIGIGPDYVDYIEEYIREILSHSPVYKAHDLTFPVGLEDVTRLPNLTEALLENGYSSHEVRNILVENLLRVFERVVG
jgi:membrane dipeptidase